jgi:hypothetical protein
MKKNILLTLIIISFSSFLFSGTIQPSLSMRFNDIVNNDAESGTIDPSLVLGFAMSLEEGVYAGKINTKNNKKTSTYLKTPQPF